MIPEIGQFALALALGVSLLQAVLSLAGAARGRAGWIAGNADLVERRALSRLTIVGHSFGGAVSIRSGRDTATWHAASTGSAQVFPA